MGELAGSFQVMVAVERLEPQEVELRQNNKESRGKIGQRTGVMRCLQSTKTHRIGGTEREIGLRQTFAVTYLFS